MLPTARSKDSFSRPLVLKLQPCPITIKTIQRTGSVSRISRVVHTERKRPSRNDDSTEEAIAHFEQSYRLSEQTRLSGNSISPIRTTKDLFANRINVLCTTLRGQNSKASTPYSSFRASRVTPNSIIDLRFIDQHCQHSSSSTGINRLPLPGSLDFDYRSVLSPQKTTRGNYFDPQLDPHLDTALTKAKEAVLKMLPVPLSLETAQQEKRVPKLSEGFSLFWSIRQTCGARPEAREGAKMCWVDRRLFLFGGLSTSKRNDVRWLSPDTWSWTIVTPKYLPKGRIGHSLVAYKNSLFLFGGWSHYSNRLHLRRCYKKLYILYLDGEVKWQRFRGVGDVPKSRRYHAATTMGCTMLLYGGVDMQSKVLHSLCSLDMETLLWTKIRASAGPGRRSNCTLTPVFHSSLLTNSDFSLLNMPKLRIDQVMNNSGFYLFGGLDENARPCNDLWILGLFESGFIWHMAQTQGNPPSPRSDHSALLISNHLVIYGGRTGNSIPDADLHILRIDNLQWERVTVGGTIPRNRWAHTAVAMGSKMLVFGGIDYSQLQPADLHVLETDQSYVSELMRQFNEKSAKIKAKVGG